MRTIIALSVIMVGLAGAVVHLDMKLDEAREQAQTSHEAAQVLSTSLDEMTESRDSWTTAYAKVFEDKNEAEKARDDWQLRCTTAKHEMEDGDATSDAVTRGAWQFYCGQR